MFCRTRSPLLSFIGLKVLYFSFIGLKVPCLMCCRTRSPQLSFIGLKVLYFSFIGLKVLCFMFCRTQNPPTFVYRSQSPLPFVSRDWFLCLVTLNSKFFILLIHQTLFSCFKGSEDSLFSCFDLSKDHPNRISVIIFTYLLFLVKDK